MDKWLAETKKIRINYRMWMKPIMMPFFYPGGHGPLWDLATQNIKHWLKLLY
jgi:hypothetical protein